MTHFQERSLLPSIIVRSGLPMVIFAKKERKPKSLFERMMQNFKQFFGRA